MEASGFRLKASNFDFDFDVSVLRYQARRGWKHVLSVQGDHKVVYLVAIVTRNRVTVLQIYNCIDSRQPFRSGGRMKVLSVFVALFVLVVPAHAAVAPGFESLQRNTKPCPPDCTPCALCGPDPVRVS